MTADPYWAQTGWRASDAGGYCIEWSLFLPCGVSVQVRRIKTGWRYRFGRFLWSPDGWSRPFKRIMDCKRNALLAVQLELCAAARAVDKLRRKRGSKR